MSKQFDVIALGELLIDFAPYGESEQGNPVFECCPGGAPCNVLSMLTKLGEKTAFYGKVGEDQFGHILRNTVDGIGIDVSHLLVDKQVNTTLAFVHQFPDGDRDFSFYRNPGADMMLTADEIDEEFIKSSKIFHFGTLSMTHEGVREATKKATLCAKEAGLLVSFDPNLREPLWNSLEDAKEQIAYGLSQCDILKIADNELVFMTGIEDYDEAMKAFRAQYDIPLIVLTLGKNGSRAYYQDEVVTVPGFLQEKTVDTTGAGDTFCGCILHHVLKYGFAGLNAETMKEMLTFANAAASLITTKRGAIRSMPEREEVMALRAERQ
ncbi:PfkB family carbohydrate kinase [Ohessyouella blattaphilus]|uniref:PfkB family carbohydrate kinase n=1 Tax=Ohessyouella blattaphilus TaxID=2949333 RepID=A0ABT1EHX0_9FIRM|nr:PfkB family carbohydrate kinase [Ohessyouella blattaphilus]MCP1110300.1 PfkB family carbohydrate kinase [Ohessyouella blattaphilus]MCR8563694.1 PfkB family carbohydrate kinase [Ohessyouella blattaphilus]